MARWGRTPLFGASAALAFTLLASPAVAQRPPDIPLDAATNRAVVEAAVRAIEKHYVAEDVARQIGRDLRRRLSRGEYDRITSAFDLIDSLDDHMQAVSKDPHLKMAYSHRATPVIPGQEIHIDTREDWEADKAAARAVNYGFEKVERMAGNVGYLRLGSFQRPEFAGPTTAAAMTFLANTDALIIDLRTSRGGSPEMVQFLASYFFADQPFLLGEFYVRPENRSQQIWTLPYVPGGRYLDRDVYVLMSRRSFSAPEGFASFLRFHKRATIVGERTLGGTHQGVFVKIHSNFAVSVPIAMAIYPVGTPVSPIGRPVHPSTWTDRHGTPVEPDITVPADRALKTAHLDVLKRMFGRDSTRTQLTPVIRDLELDLKEPATKQ